MKRLPYLLRLLICVWLLVTVFVFHSGVITAHAQTAKSTQPRCAVGFFVQVLSCLPDSVQASLGKALVSHGLHQQAGSRASSSLTVEAVGVFDLTANSQTSFVPAETVIYAALINNTSGKSIPTTFTFTTGGSSTECQFHLTGKDLSVPTGESTWYTISDLCGDEVAGTYPFMVTVTNQDSPSDTSSNEGPFTVKDDNLPNPSWWNGVCDTNTYANAPTNPTHLPAYSLPKNASVPTNYRGMLACGPRPIADGGPDVAVSFPGGRIQELEWECVELSMRFMYLTYGIPSYNAPTGALVVDNYSNYNNNRILLSVPNNPGGKPGPLPDPGDILSYNDNHTSVVLARSIDSIGNGTITVIEQNFSATGKADLPIKGWAIQGGVKNWLHHTLNLWPQRASVGSTVLVSGEGFQPNEAINFYFDVYLYRTTADEYGNFGGTLTVPQLSSGTYIISAVGATTKPITQTVFYVP